MYIKFIGCGAAGGKALINAIESGVVNKADSLITNTTIRDTDPKYRDIFMQNGDSLKGCGKERTLARNITLKTLKDNSETIDKFVTDGNPDMIVIVTSTSGGSGSGSSTILAKYIKGVHGVNVHIFAFTGFGSDGREMQNTIEFFQDIEEDFGIEAISNEKFLDGVNTLKAEALANDEFTKRMLVLQGLTIKDSVQNMDDTDLYKLATTTGFMDIEYIPLPKIKNIEMFNSILTAALDDSKSLETEPGCHRSGVIINCRESVLPFIDTEVNIAKERYGFSYESFQHIQHEEDQDEYIAIIFAGMKLPTDELKAVYEKYKLLSSKVSKGKDSFFDMVGDMRGDQEDSMFNLRSNKKQKSKNDFFSDFDTKVKEEEATKNY